MNGLSKLTVTDCVSLLFFERLPADGKGITTLLTALAEKGINLDMISQFTPVAQTVSLSFTLDDRNLVKALRICNELSAMLEGLKPMVSSENCKLQLYGEEMANTPGVAAKALSTICSCGVEVKLVTTSEVDISCLIPRIGVDDVVEALKTAFSL